MRSPVSARPSGGSTIDNAYNAQHLSVLEGLEAVRKRPGMYIGSTDSRGLMHCLWEIIDNSVDEALGGHGSGIDRSEERRVGEGCKSRWVPDTLKKKKK